MHTIYKIIMTNEINSFTFSEKDPLFQQNESQIYMKPNI